MIQVYAKKNTDYSMNGDMVLFPESCTVAAKLNGTWKMELSHPRDAEGRWRYIEEECVISAPTFMGKGQLFRIREVVKTDNEIIATALPIFLDAEDECFLMDVRPTAKNGQQALNMMMAGTKYSGRSNITSVSTAYFEVRNLINAISGEDEPTFIGRWGGEILYDNYEIIINERVGGDYGVEARYGKNMVGIDYTMDMSGVVTRIIPVAHNGRMMSGNEPWVDSENIGKYEKVYIRKVKFDDVKMREDAQEGDEEKGVIICDSQGELDRALAGRCRDLFAGGADLPVVSIEIDMIALSGTEEYKDVQILEAIGLGDDIRCRHKELDITTKERVIELEWDCCRDCIKNVTLGEPLYDYFDSTSADLESILNRISGAIAGDGSVVAGAVKGFLDATKTQLRLQNTVAKRQEVRAILFEDLDPASELFGAMALGTQGLQIAKRRTADGRDWDWTTALTANGLIANIIVAGILSDKKGLNYWDLDTGEFSLSATGFKIDGETAEDYFKENWTQVEIFNKLTNNGQNMGIYMRDGKLYLNAQYMQIGKISSKNRKVYFDLDNNELACSKMISPDTGNSLQTVVDVGYAAGVAPADYSGSLMRIYPQGNPGNAINMYVSAKGAGSITGPESGMSFTCKESNRNYSILNAMKRRMELSASYTEANGTYGKSSIELETVTGTVGGSVRITPYLSVGGNMHVDGTLRASGAKNRVVKTESYGDRLLYCYEMPSPMFGDIGGGVTDENGECIVHIEQIFLETAGTCVEYQVFLQKEGQGDLWVDRKEAEFFIVRGTENLGFSWEVKAVQKEYEYERLEELYPDELELKEYTNMGLADMEKEWKELMEQEEMEKEEAWHESIERVYGH